MENKRAGFLVRFLANIEDNLISSLLLFIPLILFTSALNNENMVSVGFNAFTFFFVVIFISGPFMILYYAYFTSKFGGTLGKLLLGLKVVDKDTSMIIDIKRAFLRSTIGYLFSSQFFGLGYYRVIKHPEKAAWHDELFNTKVLQNRSGWLGLVIVLVTIIVLGAVLALNVTNIINVFSTATPPII